MKAKNICNDCGLDISWDEYQKLSDTFCPECGGHVEEIEEEQETLKASQTIVKPADWKEEFQSHDDEDKKEDLSYCIRDLTNGNFWTPENLAMTSNIEEAKLYSKEDAENLVHYRNRIEESPLSEVVSVNDYKEPTILELTKMHHYGEIYYMKRNFKKEIQSVKSETLIKGLVIGYFVGLICGMGF